MTTRATALPPAVASQLPSSRAEAAGGGPPVPPPAPAVALAPDPADGLSPDAEGCPGFPEPPSSLHAVSTSAPASPAATATDRLRRPDRHPRTGIADPALLAPFRGASVFAIPAAVLRTVTHVTGSSKL
ncbi:hypothetical protein ACF06Q_28775 [Streptomyces leeuwenhoekii]|uniref:hypothetical protein n=1 Tax=Streptomyces leeuwenhoekii TaxID=1437453 RepID=UPI0036F7B3B9